MSYWTSNADASTAPLTREALDAAFERLRTERPIPCGSEERPHAVNPKARGWTMCGNCFGPVFVGDT